MKKLGKALVVFVIGYLVLFACAGPAKAADIWVDHWASEKVDLYVMDNTLAYGTEANGQWFSVDVKKVQNGRLEQVVTWHFLKFKTDMWKYYTNTMSGDHHTVVIARNGVFEYGMHQLGWSYSIRGMYYY